MYEMNLPDITLKTGCSCNFLHVDENSTTLQMIYMIQHNISRLLSFSLFNDAKLILIDIKIQIR